MSLLELLYHHKKSILLSFFQSVSTRTAGFNSCNIGLCVTVNSVCHDNTHVYRCVTRFHRRWIENNDLCGPMGKHDEFKVNVVAIKILKPAINDIGERFFEEEVNAVPPTDDKLIEGSILIVAGSDQQIEKFAKGKK